MRSRQKLIVLFCQAKGTWFRNAGIISTSVCMMCAPEPRPIEGEVQWIYVAGHSRGRCFLSCGSGSLPDRDHRILCPTRRRTRPRTTSSGSFFPTANQSSVRCPLNGIVVAVTACTLAARGSGLLPCVKCTTHVCSSGCSPLPLRSVILFAPPTETNAPGGPQAVLQPREGPALRRWL